MWHLQTEWYSTMECILASPLLIVCISLVFIVPCCAVQQGHIDILCECMSVHAW
jgi:hypothetical protein